MKLKKNNGRGSAARIALAFLLISSLFFSGCQSIDSMKVKMGLKNTDFEYIKQGKIEKIVIQNTRDRGFRFVVTDKKVIGDLYDMLSSAKGAKQKTSLEPDYIFEMYEGNTVHKFQYVAGLDAKDCGNLYSNDKIYVVSKRIDNDILKNFSILRMPPRDFKTVYYKSILNAVDRMNQGDLKNKKIGLDIISDVDVSRFLFSTELEEFKGKLKDKAGNVELMSTLEGKDKYDAIITVQTQGYKSDVYKAIITCSDKKSNKEKKLYVNDKYDKLQWNIQITDAKPDKF